ncbi:MAG: YciI family protein [Actinomycetota bacterium]|nr:YciI family protein [Actinomycetota bacterium]
MKYVILIHANPDPWGHPASARLYRWRAEGHVATDGPYAEAKEHLAGFFVIDCDTRTRAEEIAAQFAQPGGVVELRPVM